MTDITMTGAADSAVSHKPKLDHPPNPLTLILFFGALAAGFLFVAYSLYVDVDASGTKTTTFLPYLLLFVALVIALGKGADSEFYAGQVQSLSRAQLPAYSHETDDIITADFRHLELDISIVEHQHIADVHYLRQSRKAHRNPVAVTNDAFGCQAKLIAGS
jgi:hypothetical protein